MSGADGDGCKLKHFVRKALPGDKDAVLAILQDYDGFDYLPDYYDLFLESPNITSYVYEDAGDIIAYLAISIIDNGETAVSRAARVRPDHQGTGIYKTMLTVVDEELRNKEGVTKRVELKYPQVKKSFLEKHRQVANKTSLMFELELDATAIETMSETHTHNLEVFGEKIPPKIFAKKFTDYLFEEGRIILDWVPYRILETNGSIIKGKDTIIVSDVDINSDGLISGLVTASSLVKREGSIDTMCYLDVFGKDYRDIKTHIGFHVRRCHKTSNSYKIYLEILTSVDSNTCAIEDALCELGIKRTTSCLISDRSSHSIAYERLL